MAFHQTSSLPVRFVRSIGLHRLARKLIKFAPAPIVRWDQQRQIRERTKLVDDHAIRKCFKKVVKILQDDGIAIGDYLEFGVFNGSSLTWMSRTLQKAGLTKVRLFGFDSFEGLPDYAATDCGGHWKPGEFSSSLDFTTAVLKHEGLDMDRVHLIKGFFHDSCTPALREQHRLTRSALIMIDCDLYQSTVDALNFCEPILADTTILVFDDWFPLADKNEGEKKAFDEFLAAHPEWSAEELFPYDPAGLAFKITRAARGNA